MESTSQYSEEIEDRPEPDHAFFNRELSWIEFNSRVLDQMLDERIPLLERLRFGGIVASNFDEFFMVRVAGLKRQVRSRSYARCPSGISPREQLREISRRVHELVAIQYEHLRERLLPQMAEAGIVVHTPDTYPAEHRSYLSRLFRDEIFPVLTPVRCRSDEPMPYAGNMRLSAAFLLQPRKGARTLHSAAEASAGAEIGPRSEEVGGADSVHTSEASTGAESPPAEEQIAVVQVPRSLARLVYIPGKTGATNVALIEHVIVEHAASLFPGYTVTGTLLFRVTRDADFGVDEERDEDFVEAMEQVLEGREYSQPVRLSVSPGSERLRDFLTETLDVHPEEVYEIPDPLELKSLTELADLSGYDAYRYPEHSPNHSPVFSEDEQIFEALRRTDVLLYHPYESFSPVVRLVQQAAEDPDVLAIKMTLYRTSGGSPIVRALSRAAEEGKQVTAVVELKARFDEGQNIEWAEQLERAGVIVVYGIARLKVHAKALMIVRREPEGVRRYVHLGTGNYNEKTARLYSDLCLLTTNAEIAWDVGQFFNAITGYSVVPGFSRISMSPVGLKMKLLQLIHRETMRAESEGTGHIIAKINSLADGEIIEALYTASSAGVTVELNVRGICMLVPGLPGRSENIRVVSIVGRFLEHARAFYFHNGGNEEVFLSSADWMPRNLERRVELLFPVENPELRERVKQVLTLHMRETEQGYELTPGGAYRRLGPASAEAVHSQQQLDEAAREAAESSSPGARTQFVVRRKPPKPRGR